MNKAPQAKFSLFMPLNCIFSVNFRNFHDLENVRVRALKKCESESESESNIFFECESESESTKIVRVHRVRMRVRVRVYIPDYIKCLFNKMPFYLVQIAKKCYSI